jgi:hypothetical protein
MSKDSRMKFLIGLVCLNVWHELVNNLKIHILAFVGREYLLAAVA